MDEYTIMDETTLRQMSALKADNAAALTVIGNLKQRVEGNAELINTLTAKNVELKREIRQTRYECHKALNEAKNISQRRETVAAILGAIGGFLATSVIVIIYYATRAGIM